MHQQEVLSARECMKIIRGRYESDDVKYLHHEICPYSENLEGLLGDHYKLEISYELNNKEYKDSFFVKTKPIKPGVQELMTSEMNVYPKEIFWYTVLLKEFQKCGFDTSFSPNCYYYIPGRLLVLDDMQLKGYWISEMYKPFDLDQCKCSLKSLALMHAAGYMYEELKTEELKRPFHLNVEFSEYLAEENMFVYSADKNNYGFKWIEVCLPGFLKLIEHLEESNEYKEEFKKELRKRKLGEIFLQESTLRKTIGHGDLWSNNILFKTCNGITEHACLIDYQFVRYFYPVFDICLLIYTNTNREFRQQQWQQLMDYYYNNLTEILTKHNFSIKEIFTKEAFEQGLKIVRFDAMMQSFSSLSFSCLSSEDFSQEAEQGGPSFDHLLFKDRKSIMCKYFKANEKYRQLMIDCMYDLHDGLFKN